MRFDLVEGVFVHTEIANAEVGVKVYTSSNDTIAFEIRDSAVHHHSRGGVSVEVRPGGFIPARRPDISNGGIIRNNEIAFNGLAGIELTSYSSGCGGAWNTIEVVGNDIHDNANGILLDASSSFGIGCIAVRSATVDSKIHGNVIRNNSQSGVSANGSRYPNSRFTVNCVRTSPEIFNNLILSNGMFGVLLSATPIASLSAKIVNNTIVHNADTGIRHSALDSEDINGGFTLQNNLLVSNRIGIERTEFTGPMPTNFAVGYNNVFGNRTNWVNYPPAFGSLTEVNISGTLADWQLNISTEPQFVSSRDLRLRATSPAVNSGNPTNAPLFDIDGQKRGAFPDIGFDEVLLSWHRKADDLLLEINGVPGTLYVLESSSNLVNWTSISIPTNQTGAFESVQSLLQPHGFFRLHTR